MNRWRGHDPERLLSRFADLQDEARINLHVAENVLLFDQLRQAFTSDCSLAIADVKYQASHGSDPFNAALAAFLSRSFGLQGGAVIGREHVSCFAGVRGALDVAARALLPRGCGVLMTAPYWQGFEWVYGDRLEGEILPVPLDSESGFELTLAQVRAAYERAKPAPAALVLTHPNNPLGVNYPKRLLEEILRWVLEETQMQVVSDEIYAHCQMPNLGGPPFASVLALPIALAHPKRVHVVWGFAKDFGVSGFRAGALISRSAALHAAVRTAAGAGFSPLTSSNTWFLRKLFVPPPGGGDPTWADRMMRTLRTRLAASHEAVTTALDRRKIPRFEGTHAAQFAWLDLRKWLPPAAPEALAAEAFPALRGVELLGELAVDPRERKLYLKLFEEALVSLLPGGTLTTAEPGFFRLCFTAEPPATVVEAVNRIGDVLESPV